MSKRDAALSTLLSMGIALSATIVSNQLDIRLEDQAKAGKEKADDPPRVYETIGGPKAWDAIYDVVIVGSGAAGLMAGISASWAKPDCRVLIIESLDEVGGTTLKSGGVFWLPNNVKMTIPDSRDQTIRLLARSAYPEKFDATKECLGLAADDYSRICQFYDLGRPLSEQLETFAYKLNRVRDSDNQFLYDYTYSADNQPENVAPQQRHLGIGMPIIERSVFQGLTKAIALSLPMLRELQKRLPFLREISSLETFSLNLTYGFGSHLVQALRKEFLRNGMGRIQLQSEVDGIILDDGTVVGVQILNKKTNKHELIGATRGVIFASGGFAHNRSLVDKHLISRGKFVSRTGAAKGATGTFLLLCEKLGAAIDEQDMEKIWGCEAVYSESVTEWETPTCLFQMRGDSFFVVGPNGKRVYNEKMKYDLRARKHWGLPKDACAQPEKGVFFMIGDERCVHIFGGETLANSWPRDPNDPKYIRGNTLEELVANITRRFPGFVHPSDFKTNLPKTFKTFNSYARSGVDSEFGRGKMPSDSQWTNTGIDSEMLPNRSMYPLNEVGPYFALPIVASIIDTKGGPKVDAASRVLKEDGSCIDRLFGAGNCANSLTGDTYLSGGLTLGPALVSGYVAGMQCILRGPGGAKL